jgi:hypothetical protein
MKLLGKKSISTYLFHGIRTAAICCSILVLYIIISVAFDNYKIENGRYIIPFPLISYFDIKGVYKPTIFTAVILILLYISIFLYSLSLILKSFKSEVLFSSNSISNLNFFAVLNLLGFPIFYVVLRMVILKIPLLGGMHNFILSMILGVFVLFVSAIFKRGLKVQNENDLTI